MNQVKTREATYDRTGVRDVPLRANRRMLSGRLLSLAALLLGLVGGCESYSENSEMANAYYLNPHKDLRKLGRVALAELDNRSAYPEIASDVTEALFVALQKKQLFGLTNIGQDDPAWRTLQENLDSFEALRQLLVMRDALKCSGLLVGSITQYQPYPRLVIGVRVKLLDLADGQLVWGLEQIWDSADKSVQRRIQAYFKDQVRSGYAPLREELVVISSLEFAKFVAYEMAQTLDRNQSNPGRM